ncbi:hypothetical protein FPN186_contig00139-0001 [Flavobacterium psychrophilum]|nr:hypothetical protein FPN186_contig00139-0001 [Flavobacterium psychrophilum]
MKAIHNALVGINESIFVGNYKLKYNFESNSQLARPKNEQLYSW